MRPVHWRFVAALAAMSATFAAVLAHVAIDALGDVLLRNDTYDAVPHESRALAFAIAGAVGLLFALRYLWEALDRRSGALVQTLDRFGGLRRAVSWRFTVAVAALTVAVLVAMELCDAAAFGLPAGSLRDLLGGSVALGLGTALAFGAGLGIVGCRLLALLSAWRPLVAAFLERLLVDARPQCAPHRGRALRTPASSMRRLVLARRAGKRAPPRLAAV